MSLSTIITHLIDRFYVPFVKRFMPLQMFRYAACGGINFLLLDPFYYFLLYNYVIGHRFTDLGFVVLSPHIAAMILVFPVTFFNGFWLNKHVAFKLSPLRTRTQLWRYALSVVGSILLTYVGLKFFVEVCHIWPTPSKIITTILTTIYSFLAAKYFSFRHSVEE